MKITRVIRTTLPLLPSPQRQCALGPNWWRVRASALQRSSTTGSLLRRWKRTTLQQAYDYPSVCVRGKHGIRGGSRQNGKDLLIDLHNADTDGVTGLSIYFTDSDLDLRVHVIVHVRNDAIKVEMTAFM